jgi:hypothetical protein
MNYSELTTAIQNYCETTFTSTELATFVEQAEQNIYNTVQLPSLRKNVTGYLTTGNKYLSAPTDLLSVFSLAVIQADGSYEYLLNKDVNFIRQAYPTPTDTGLPRHYAIFGPQFSYPNELSLIVGPTPDANYEVELHYYFYPESIVTAGTSWLGDNYDTALLNGSLIEAITFMKGEPDMVNLYKERYAASMQLLKNLGDGKLRMDAYRDGQVRYPVK